MTNPLKDLAPEVAEVVRHYADLRVAGVQRGHSHQENLLQARIAQLERQLRVAGIEPVLQEEASDE